MYDKDQKVIVSMRATKTPIIGVIGVVLSVFTAGLAPVYKVHLVDERRVEYVTPAELQPFYTT